MSKKKQQTIAKRNRERAIEEKRRLKRERKQAEREAVRSGEPSPFAAEYAQRIERAGGEPEPADSEQAPGEGEAAQPAAVPADGV